MIFIAYIYMIFIAYIISLIEKNKAKWFFLIIRRLLYDFYRLYLKFRRKE